MPEISRFYGIVIRMYYDEHAPPHFHAYYQDEEATVNIETLELGRGRLSRRAMVLVVEWAMSHREELRGNWRRIELGVELAAIEPLE